jgi:hypothetical protein
MPKKQVILVLGHEDAEVVERALANHGVDVNTRFQMRASSLSEKENRWLLSERMRSANIATALKSIIVDEKPQVPHVPTQEVAEAMLAGVVEYFSRTGTEGQLMDLLTEEHHVI